MVEWKKLGEVCDIKTGKGITQKDCSEKGIYPVISGGQTPMGMYIQYNRDADTVTISRVGAYAGFVSFIHEKFYLNDKCFSIIPFSVGLNKKFLYCVLKGKEEEIKKLQSEGGVPTINTQKLGKVIIPIPSQEEQQRIVGILDTFTASIDNLKEQIAQRRKQYEYYRDSLLDLEGKDGVVMKTIGDLFVFKNGLNKEKKYFGKGNPIVNYTDVYHNKRIYGKSLIGRVTLSESEIERFSVFRGDVFFTRTSETPEEVGYAAVLLDNIENCTFSGFLLRARPITNLLLPEYCAYCFGSYEVRQAIVKYSTFTTRALTNGPSLSKISIPVPSLAEQQRIVNILDTFEASIQNLEAQLKEREKQYEYYRNKLLTFE